uniref:Olduvai domain-containing protein n=3 Tax=Macaca mulatta TaxID=9544 RepID=A0A5F8A0B6_MACMU
MQKLPHSVHQEQPHTVWAVRKSCQIQQPLKIRMVKQNNIIPGETQILLRFTGWESNVNVKKQPPVGIKCEPMDQEYEECKELIKSMLRDELQFKGEKLAEQLKQAEELRQYKVLVHSQARELTQLREKLREGRDASHSLTQHLQALLTPDEPDKSQRQDLREQLAEECRLAQHLVQKLSPENGQGEDADVQVEEAEKVQDSCAPREVQKAEEREVPEDSLEECAVTYSNSHGPYDSNQPHRNTKITFVEDEVDSTLIDSSFHDEWRMLYILSQKVKVMMRKRKKKGQCLPGICRSLKRRKPPGVLG